MKVTAWKSSLLEKSAVFGVSIGTKNRENYFVAGWKTVTIEIEDGEVIQAKLTPGFWKDCPEIRNPAFREWFKTQGVLQRWQKRSPPKFELEALGEKHERRFRLSRPI